MTGVVLNGFFRSGTSILWRALHTANANAGVLYEPCHPDLPGLVETSIQKNEAHPIHGFTLWDSYGTDIRRLRAVHEGYPARDHVFCQDGKAAADYAAQLFDELGASVLQVNRWHLVLEEVNRRSDAKVLHVMRDPRDIYASYVSIFQNRRSAISRALLRVLKSNYMPPRSWDMLSALNEFPCPTPSAVSELKQVHPLLSRRGFDVTFAVWLLFNAAAVRDTLKIGGRVMWIENIVRDPMPFVAVFEAEGLGCDTSIFRPDKVGAPLNASGIAELGDLAARLGLSDAWNTINSTLPVSSGRHS